MLPFVSPQYPGRPDGSTYHVALYDRDSGKRLLQRTHQGYADDSTWARYAAPAAARSALAPACCCVPGAAAPVTYPDGCEVVLQISQF